MAGFDKDTLPDNYFGMVEVLQDRLDEAPVGSDDYKNIVDTAIDKLNTYGVKVDSDNGGTWQPDKFDSSISGYLNINEDGKVDLQISVVTDSGSTAHLVVEDISSEQYDKIDKDAITGVQDSTGFYDIFHDVETVADKIEDARDFIEENEFDSVDRGIEIFDNEDIADAVAVSELEEDVTDINNDVDLNEFDSENRVEEIEYNLDDFNDNELLVAETESGFDTGVSDYAEHIADDEVPFSSIMKTLFEEEAGSNSLSRDKIESEFDKLLDKVHDLGLDFNDNRKEFEDGIENKVEDNVSVFEDDKIDNIEDNASSFEEDRPDHIEDNVAAFDDEKEEKVENNIEAFEDGNTDNVEDNIGAFESEDDTVDKDNDSESADSSDFYDEWDDLD